MCALRSGMSASAQLIGAVHAYASGCGAAAAARQASRSQSPPPSIPAAHTRKGRVLHAAGPQHQGHTGCPAARREDGFRWAVPCPVAGNMLSHPAALQAHGAYDGRAAPRQDALAVCRRDSGCASLVREARRKEAWLSLVSAGCVVSAVSARGCVCTCSSVSTSLLGVRRIRFL